MLSKTRAEHEKCFKCAAILPREEYFQSNHQRRWTSTGWREESMKQSNVDGHRRKQQESERYEYSTQ